MVLIVGITREPFENLFEAKLLVPFRVPSIIPIG